MIDTLAQIVGIIAMLIVLGSYHPKHRKNILKSQMIANMLWVIHFGLLGATTGAALNGAAGVRAYLFNTKYAHSKKRSIWLLWSVCLMMGLLTAFTWQGPMSLLPFTGIIIGTIAFWQHDPQRIRLLLLATFPFWMIYNALSGSYAGMATELFALFSITLALFRHSSNPQKARIRAAVSILSR